MLMVLSRVPACINASSVPGPPCDKFPERGALQRNPIALFKNNDAGFVMNGEYMRCRASSDASSRGMPRLRRALSMTRLCPTMRGFKSLNKMSHFPL